MNFILTFLFKSNRLLFGMCANAEAKKKRGGGVLYTFSVPILI